MPTRTPKLKLSRETMRRLVDAAAAEAASRFCTDAYTYCTPCPESYDGACTV